MQTCALKHVFLAKCFLVELIKYNPIAREIRALLALVRALLTPVLKSRLESLTQAYQLASFGPILTLIHRFIRPHVPFVSTHGNGGVWSRDEIGWGRYTAKLSDAPGVNRTLLLKTPGPNGEKGVIISYFEYNWLKLLRGIKDFNDFENRYTLILSASWSPTNYNILGLALEKTFGPVFVQLTNYGEKEKLEQFHPRLIGLDALTCDWLDPTMYKPKRWEDRCIDILVVSNWAPFKRHWHLFQILSKLPHDLKVVCVGQPEGAHNLDSIRKQQALMGAKQQIDYFESIPIEEVINLECNSKIALILSRREGGCGAATEALMAGAPLGLLSAAHVGAKAHINEETGILINSKCPEKQILGLLDRGGSLKPREWAIENIACQKTCGKLNDTLRDHAQKMGQPWTSDLLLPRLSPYFTYKNKSDFLKVRDEAKLLSDSYPEVFPKDWIENAIK